MTNKYTRFIGPTRAPVDVYDVLEAFQVANPAVAHAVKKLLAPGQRGSKGLLMDLQEAAQSIERAIEQYAYTGVAREEKYSLTIPDDVYYSSENDNFHAVADGKCLGAYFHRQWLNRRDEFPIKQRD